MPSLDFEGQSTLYATHGLHAYAAKCPPRLVRYGLRYYSRPGDLVLDPMAGSGTTLVESRLMGRNARGFDIDPLARLIARVKCNPLNDSIIGRSYAEVKAQTDLDVRLLRSGFSPSAVRDRATLPDFPNRDYWFAHRVAEELALLSYHIGHTPMPEAYRDFLWVAFSSLILAKSSVANARDIIHSRHHYFAHLHTPHVLSKFDARVKQMRRQMSEFCASCQGEHQITTSVRAGDARHLPLGDETIDLVFTSPPYATALDYPRAHFLAVAWMQSALGTTLEDYKSRASRYIGTSHGKLPRANAALMEQFALAQSVVDDLARQSVRDSALTCRYFVDMSAAFHEMQRVLKKGRHAIIVVCPSHIRKIVIPTHEVFAELGAAVGLKLKKQYERTISERLRLLPYMKESFGERMATEYVLIFQKAP